MSAAPRLAASHVDVLAAAPVRLAGVTGVRYRIHHPQTVTGDADLDRALSTFEAVVLEPLGRPAAEAPVATLLNGITVGLDRGLPAGVALARRGMGAVLFDTPLGGARRPGGGAGRDPRAALAEIARRGVALDVPFAGRLFDSVAADLPALLGLAAARHGLAEAVAPGGRVALVGVSFGALLSALAFGRDGVGGRLLGAIGHPDLPGMARGFATTMAGYAGVPTNLLVGGAALGPLAEAAARRWGGDAAVGAFRLARLFLRLGRGAPGVSPLGWAAQVAPERPVAFLAGELDPVAPPEAVRRAAQAYPAHTVDVAPRLGHGWYPAGGGLFERDLEAFLVRHLSDWTR